MTALFDESGNVSLLLTKRATINLTFLKINSSLERQQIALKS